MAKISAYTTRTTPLRTDNVVLQEGSNNWKAPLDKLNPAIWARAFHNANQSISNVTATALALNSERADTDTIHDTVTNNSRLTCKTAGVYSVSGTVGFAAHATGWREVAIRLNGTTVIALSRMDNTGGTDSMHLTIHATYPLAVNDYVELVVQQNSGGALNVLSSANYSPEFSMIRLGF